MSKVYDFALRTVKLQLINKLQHVSILNWQRLCLRLGVNIDDQLWLRLNPIPIHNCKVCNVLTLALALTLTGPLTRTNRRTLTMAVVRVQWCTAPACYQADSQQQAVRKRSVRDMATPRRKRSHYVLN